MVELVGNYTIVPTHGSLLGLTTQPPGLTTWYESLKSQVPTKLKEKEIQRSRGSIRWTMADALNNYSKVV